MVISYFDKSTTVVKDVTVRGNWAKGIWELSVLLSLKYFGKSNVILK